MDNTVEFPDGIFAKAPHPNAPDFVKGKVSIKLAEAIAYLQSKADQGEEWLSLDIKESRGGKWYASVDTWQPSGGNAVAKQSQPTIDSAADASSPVADDDYDDIPF